MAAAAQLAPVRSRSVNQIGPVGERAHERNREPVARRNAHTHLILHVMREVRQRVALRRAAFVCDFFVAASKGNRLEREERNLFRIIQRELNDRAHLLVVHAVDDRDHRNNVDAVRVQIFNGLQLHVEEVADRAMGIRRIADAVELQVRVTQTRLRRSSGKTPDSLAEFNAVRRRLHAVAWPNQLCGRISPRRGRMATASAHRLKIAPTSGVSA